jgi:hypothetical protein
MSVTVTTRNSIYEFKSTKVTRINALMGAEVFELIDTEGIEVGQPANLRIYDPVKNWTGTITTSTVVRIVTTNEA